MKVKVALLMSLCLVLYGCILPFSLGEHVGFEGQARESQVSFDELAFEVLKDKEYFGLQITYKKQRTLASKCFD